jgi:hypothetical protein
MRDYGNREHGDCTKASQAFLARFMQRLEHRATIDFTTDEVLRVYYNLTKLYGGGDTGAYEMDALSQWRRADETFRDLKGRPHTIDAYMAANHRSLEDMKRALVLAGAHGIKACFGLPAAWGDTLVWDIPEGQQPIGEYEPYSWGGHSMTLRDYSKGWWYACNTWNDVDIKISDKALMTYIDEAYVCVDSADSWKRRLGKLFNVNAMIYDVNSVSTTKI